MDINRRCDYAFRILRVAHERAGAFVSVAEISEFEDIPYAFARSIQHDLVQAGMLKTVRGARGGLSLDCDPYQVTMYDLLQALGEPVSVSTCSRDPEFCQKKETCAFHAMWMGADNLLQKYFKAITLGDVLDKGERHLVVQEALAATFAGRDLDASA